MRKILTTILFTLIFCSSVFAKFEMNFSIPLILGFDFIDIDGESGHMKTSNYPYIDYDAMKKYDDSLSIGAGIQVGNRFILREDEALSMSVSLLLDVGYLFSWQSITFNDNGASSYFGYVKEQDLFSHSLVIGIIPKFNMHSKGSIVKPVSIGIGAGVKLPLMYNVHTLVRPRHATWEDERLYKSDYSFSDIKKMYNYPVIPYIKLVFDGYSYMGKNFAIITTTFISYNFPIKYNVSKINDDNNKNLGPFDTSLNLKEYKRSSLDIGVSFGLYFGSLD